MLYKNGIARHCIIAVYNRRYTCLFAHPSHSRTVRRSGSEGPETFSLPVSYISSSFSASKHRGEISTGHRQRNAKLYRRGMKNVNLSKLISRKIL